MTSLISPTMLGRMYVRQAEWMEHLRSKDEAKVYCYNSNNITAKSSCFVPSERRQTSGACLITGKTENL